MGMIVTDINRAMQALQDKICERYVRCNFKLGFSFALLGVVLIVWWLMVVA